MSLLEQAIGIAVEAHRGQRDRSGQPYILHPLRMMCRVQTEAEKIVAVLHDVVEDTDWTLDGLRAKGFPEEIVRAIDCLTKRAGEPYEQFIDRAKQDSLARRVKLADLQDNMDLRRNGAVAEKDLDRLNRYWRAWDSLTGEVRPNTGPAPTRLCTALGEIERVFSILLQLTELHPRRNL